MVIRRPMDRALQMHVIYDHPIDFPEHFVVRVWVIPPLGGEMPSRGYVLASTIEEARAAIPAGLFCMPRLPDDDPAIVEVWL